MTRRDAPIAIAGLLMAGSLVAPFLSTPGWLAPIMMLSSLAIAEGALLLERRRS
jgi:hypothetical protein